MERYISELQKATVLALDASIDQGEWDMSHFFLSILQGLEHVSPSV